MGQQEEKDQALGPGDSVQGLENHSLAACVDDLLLALDLHRLVFLYGYAIGLGSVVKPRKAPRVMAPGVLLPDVTKEELAGAGKEFILQLKPTLERYAHQVLHELGNRKERRYWDISPTTAYYLEGTSERILATCGQVSAKDERGAYKDLVDSAMRVTHDNGQSIWNASKNVRWEFLEELDTVLKNVKEATVHVRRAGAGPDASKEPSKARQARRKAVRDPEEGFSLWPDHGDACFIVDGERIRFHLDGKIKDLRLTNMSQAHKLLKCLTCGALRRHDIKELSKTRTKPCWIVNNVNKLLSTKVRQLGFLGVPNKVRFVFYDRMKDCYVSLLPLYPTLETFTKGEVWKSLTNG